VQCRPPDCPSARRQRYRLWRTTVEVDRRRQTTASKTTLAQWRASNN